MLLALLLSVSTVIPLAALALAPTECGTQCCRKGKSCCCRKNSLPTTTGPLLSARTCPIGCGQPATLPILRIVWQGIAVYLPSVIAATASTLWLQPYSACGVLLCFALLQRPPPARRLPKFA